MKIPLLAAAFYCLLIGTVSAQSKTELGITAEGSLFIPGKSSEYLPSNKNGFSAGSGVYVSRDIFGKLSADAGLLYRYKVMKEDYKVPNYFVAYDGDVEIYVPYGTPYGYGFHYDFSKSGKINGWKTYPLHYLVMPVHLQYLVYRNIFVRGGIEASWLTNYDAGNDNPEFNWTLGFGNQQHKLKWSVNYIRGFKDVGFANNLYAMDEMQSATVYRNNMVQLSLSYPIWQKK